MSQKTIVTLARSLSRLRSAPLAITTLFVAIAFHWAWNDDSLTTPPPYQALGRDMRNFALAVLVLVATSSLAAGQNRPIRFWNLTHNTISEFYLAPAGTTNWGANQCKNDRDGTVDPDERLRITGTAPGTYDAKFKDTTGRTCTVSNVKVEAGEIFSIEERDVTSCDR